MTQKDQKIVMILVLTLVSLGVVGFFVKKSYWDPLSDYSSKIADVEDKIVQKEYELQQIELGKKNLADARTKSLPIKQEKALLDYTGYIHQLLNISGLTVVDVKPPDLKATADKMAAPSAAKKSGHIILPFTVQAKGKLASVVAFMDGLQRTPVMHRVKSMTLGHQDTAAAAKGPASDTINVNMTLEAMIVAGTKAGFEPTLKPSTSLVLPSPASPRRYADIARANIFLGRVIGDKDLAPRSTDETEQIVMDYMKLVQTDVVSQEAFLHMLLFQGRDQRIKSRANSGYDTFQIVAEKGKVVLKAYVLRIDQRDVYFQVKDFVYALHVGQTVSDAMRRPPLPDPELEQLNLMELVRAYDAKSDGTTKETTKKGPKTRQKGI